MGKHADEDNMNVVIRRLTIAALAVFAIALAGCAATEKKYNATTGKKISSTPVAVAVMQAGAAQLKACPKPAFYGFTVNEITQLSASAQAEAIRNIPTLILLDMVREQNGGNCYTAIAKTTQEFFRAEAVKYQQWGMFGRTGVVGGFAYLGAKSLFDAFAAASIAGDTTIGSVNVSPGSAAGEGAGGSGTATLNTNVGSGNSVNTLDSGSQINQAEKQLLAPVTGGGNSTPLLDDSGDGSGNKAGLNPF